MIDKRKKIIFIHIPKTGGTSMENALRGKLGQLFTTHRKASEYASHNDLDKFFKFTIVRNPWDKMVSEYFYYREGGSKGFKKDKILSRKMPDSFLRFIKNDFWPLKPERPKHHCTQLSFLGANKKENVMDYVCKFETLRKDAAVVSGKIGFHLNLPHLRKSKHSHYSEYYDDEAREIVADAYREDIQYFGYKFGVS